MELLKLILFTLIMTFGIGSARAACTVKTEDPMIQQFYRSKGLEVDSEKGDFKVEFEVTCEAIEQKKEKFSTSEIQRTTTKIEVFNEYENIQRVVYHSQSIEKKSGRVESSLVVPCADTRKAKLKLLEASLIAIKDITCEEEE